MSLTPAEVRTVAFKTAPMGKRGFDAEDVDAFLDEVERELARLIEENDELRARVGRGGVRTGAGEDPQLVAELTDVRAQLDRLQRDRTAAEQTARSIEAELDKARFHSGTAMAGDEQVLKMLLMAQRTADDHLANARREADLLLSDARSKAGELTREARARADAVERDARRHHQEAMEGLDAKRTTLLKDIEELKQFGYWYRSRLEAHLESQMQEIDERGRPGSNGAGPAYG